MSYLGVAWSWLLRQGRVSPAAYRVLTGLAMIYVATLFGGVAESDPAAGPVAVALLALGVVLVGRGVLALRSRRRAGSA